MIDIVEVKTQIRKGNLEVSEFNGNLLLKDKKSGEAVQLCAIPGIKEYQYRPTDEQWRKIRKLASKDDSASPNDVYVITAELCTNKVDKDYECFAAECLPEMAEMFIGMRGIIESNQRLYNYNAVIYDTETVIKDGITSIRAYIFVYRNKETEKTLESIINGHAPELSIGAAMKKSTCSICGNEYGGTHCHHSKGKYYDGELCYAILSDPDTVFEFGTVF